MVERQRRRGFEGYAGAGICICVVFASVDEAESVVNRVFQRVNKAESVVIRGFDRVNKAESVVITGLQAIEGIFI